MFISFLYTFRATICPLSGETTVFMGDLVLVILFLLMMGTLSPETCRENKHTKKNYAPTWLYLQYYTGMHGQQNIKFVTDVSGVFCGLGCNRRFGFL